MYGSGLLFSPFVRSPITSPTTPLISRRSSGKDSMEPLSTISRSRMIFNLLIFSSPLNVLLLMMPLAIWAYLGHWSSSLVFGFNFLVMLPLANLLGEATELVALTVGETQGGLLNATFGNAVEVVIAILALRQGELEVVQSSMIGSCLSNLLFVLGCCFIAGGTVAKECTFNATGASANSSLLILSSFAMLLPMYCRANLQADNSSGADNIVLISRITSIFLLFMYLQLLYFQLKTHLYLFEAPVEIGEEGEEEDGEVEEDEEPQVTFRESLSLLAGLTFLITIFSQMFVSSIDGFTQEFHVSKSFVGLIILPIVGNAVEHLTAIKVALNDKMELAMAVAVGSATQISLFVVPVVVLAGWVLDQPMSLAFPAFDVMTYVMAIIIVYAIIADGKSNWLEGSMLLTAYCLIAVSLLLV